MSQSPFPIPSLAEAPGTVDDAGMETHEWFERTEEGKVYYRANYYLNHGWTIMTTMQKRNPTWTDLKPVPLPVLQELRDIVWNKYQRKRLPWERVAELDKMLEELGDG